MSGPTAAALLLEEVKLPPLWLTRTSFEPGLHLVLGTPADGTPELVTAAAGLAPIKQARVLLGGNLLRESAALRRRTGVLLAEEEAPPLASSVREQVENALRIRGDGRIAMDLLNEHGLESLSARHPRDLSPGERRGVSLVLALSVRDALLCVLWEPCTNVGPLAPATVATRIKVLQSSSVVLVVTASPQVAASFGHSALLLRHGKLHDSPIDLEELDRAHTSLEMLEAQIAGATRAAFEQSYARATPGVSTLVQATSGTGPGAPSVPAPPSGTAGVWPPPKPEGEAQ